MKYTFLVAASFLLTSPVVQSQSTSRDVAIQHIEAAYFKNNMFFADSLYVDALLRPAKAVNSKITDDEWKRLKPEFLEAFAKTMLDSGGTIDVALRGITRDLSDDELLRLQAVLQDPVYIKFHLAMIAPDVQGRILRTVTTNAKRLYASANTVLAVHGMTEVP